MNMKGFFDNEFNLNMLIDSLEKDGRYYGAERRQDWEEHLDSMIKPLIESS